MASTWQGGNDNWTNGQDWSPAGVPGAGDDVVVNSGDPQVTTNVETIASLAVGQSALAAVNITDSQTTPTTTGDLAVSGPTDIYGEGTVDLSSGGALTSGSLTNAGLLSLDGGVFSGSGDSSVNVQGLLDNTGSINRSSTFDQRTSGDLITTVELTNTGSIGFGGASNELNELNVTGQQAGFGTGGLLTGNISLADNSIIQFAGGGIDTISGSLTLDGTEASIQDAGGGVNGALTGLSEIETNSSLSLGDAASLTVNGSLNNDGAIGLDTFSTSVGGTSLTVEGELTNSSSGNISIDAKNGADTITAEELSNPDQGANGGNINLTGSTSGPYLAELNITNQAAGFGAAGVLTGSVNLTGDALIQFDGGEITTIGGGTFGTRGQLLLDGNEASVSNGGGSNSGLALANIEANSTLELLDGASVTTGNLDDAGSIGLDTYYNTQSGSSLTVNGTLTDTGSIGVDAAHAQDTLTAEYLDSTGSISLSGGTSTLAKINVVGQPAGFGVAGEVTGSVSLYGDSLLQFAGGALTSIAGSSSLTLDGTLESVSNGGGQNSAVTSLDQNSGGFNLQDGASLALSVGFVNSGNISINNFHEATADVLNVAGTLTNSGTISLSPDQAATTIDTLGLVSSGTLNLTGSNDGGNVEALINVTGQAAGFGTAGVLTGNVNLYGEHGSAVLEFVSGGVTSIAANSELTLDGNLASLQIAGGAQNGALSGLSNIAGTLTVEGGAALSTGGAATGAADEFTVGETLAVSGQIYATTLEVASTGNVDLTNGHVNAAVNVDGGGVFGGTGSAGAVNVASGGAFDPGEGAGVLNTGGLSMTAGSSFGVEIGGANSGQYDQDNVSGTVSLNGASLNAALIGGFTPTTGETFTIINNDGSDAVSGTFAGLAQGATTDIGGYDFTINYAGGDGNDVVLTADGIACYCRGTHIFTADGYAPVESLAIGDRLVTASGPQRRIKWIGRRSYSGRFANRNREVLPICIKVGAFSDSVPRRDLWVSPKHAMFLNGVLIDAERLVNDVSIVRADRVELVEYFHIELDSHDVIVAEGALSETFVDDDSRGLFHNAGEFTELYPSERTKAPKYCAPRVAEGLLLEQIWRRLAKRAGRATLAS